MEQRASRSRHNCLLTSYHHHLHPNSARTRPLDAPVHKKKVSTSNIFFTCYFVFFHFFLLFPPLSPLFLSPTCVPLRETRGGYLWEPGDSCAKRAESLGVFFVFFFWGGIFLPCFRMCSRTKILRHPTCSATHLFKHFSNHLNGFVYETGCRTVND